VNCLVYPTPFMTIHNLFILHHTFYDQKIAINFHLEKFTKPFDNKASQMQKLPSIVLKQEGWEILDLTEHEFKSWTYEERVNNVMDWLRAAKERQIEKEVILRHPIQYV